MCGYKKLYCICFEKLWPEFSQNSTTKSRHRKFPNINFKFCKGACLPIDYVQKNCQSHGDVMSGYLTKCSLQRMITAVLIFTIIFSK